MIMDKIKSKFILKVYHEEYFGEKGYAYLRKMGNIAYALTFTDDIYKAKMFDSKGTAQKAADRAIGYVKEAYEKGWTSYGYDYQIDKGFFGKVMQEIRVEVIEVKLSIVE